MNIFGCIPLRHLNPRVRLIKLMGNWENRPSEGFISIPEILSHAQDSEFTQGAFTLLTSRFLNSRFFVSPFTLAQKKKT